MRCSFRSHLGISLTPHSLVYGSVCPSTHPSCLGVPLSIPIPLCSSSPSFGQAAGLAEVHVWGESPRFSDRGACSRSRPGGMQGLPPAPRSPPCLPPQPGVSPARHFGKGSPVVHVVLAVSISCSKMCFHIYMSRGWAWWHPLNLHLFIL